MINHLTGSASAVKEGALTTGFGDGTKTDGSISTWSL